MAPEPRVALITGAGRGIGRAVALRLAARGMHCVLTSRTPGGLEETDDLIAASGAPRATLLPLDLGDGAKVDLTGPSLLRRFGRLDVLVHTAATVVVPAPLVHLRDTDWDRILRVNVTGTMRLLRTVTPLLRASQRGRAVLLTCSAGKPQPYHAAAMAAAGAVEGLFRSWEAEMADCPGFRAWLKDPGPVATRNRTFTFPAEDQCCLQSADKVAASLAELC